MQGESWRSERKSESGNGTSDACEEVDITKFDRLFFERTIGVNESEKEDNLGGNLFESVKVAPLGRFFLYLNNLLFGLRVFEGVVGDLSVCLRNAHSFVSASGGA